MRYEFYGRKSPNVGKTLWEIVGNLKNFGVGRLIQKCRAEKYKNPSFIKINKVQPLPPPKSQFHQRSVMVWVDEYFNGKKKAENECWKTSYIPMYQLVPKREEEGLWKKLKECQQNVRERRIHKYLYWPPLYKKLREAAAAKDPNIVQLPNLQNVCKPRSEADVVYLDEVKEPPKCELYKTKASVEEKLKEIVRLKKIIITKTVRE